MFILGSSNSKSSASAMPSPSHLHDCHPPLGFTPLMDLPSNQSSLTVINCDKLTSQVEWDLQGLASLNSNKISDPWIVWGFNCTPLLKNLEICECPKLQSSTEELLPLLKGQRKFWTGEDWHHIADILHIVNDDQIL